MYQAKGISTLQVLQLANSQGIPIYTITQNNISSALPILQISSEVKTDIQNAVNAGKTVIVPKQDITYYTWTGTGYIVMDPQTGAGAYMISTSLSGGGCCIAAGGLPVIMLAQAGSTPTVPMAICHVANNTGNQQTFDSLMCFVGSFAIPFLAAFSYAGFAQIPAWLTIFAPFGIVGALIILAAILFTLFLMLVLATYVHSCYNVLTSKNIEERTPNYINASISPKGEKWRKNLQNLAKEFLLYYR